MADEVSEEAESEISDRIELEEAEMEEEKEEEMVFVVVDLPKDSFFINFASFPPFAILSV